MTKFSREMKKLTIGNAGSKKVPVVLLDSGETRSGRKFRNSHPSADSLPHPQPISMGSIHYPSPTSPPYTPTESAYWNPREGAEESKEDGSIRFDEDDESTEDVPSEEESLDEQTQITKVWRFDPTTGWYIRSYRANL